MSRGRLKGMHYPDAGNPRRLRLPEKKPNGSMTNSPLSANSSHQRTLESDRFRRCTINPARFRVDELTEPIQLHRSAPGRYLGQHAFGAAMVEFCPSHRRPGRSRRNRNSGRTRSRDPARHDIRSKLLPGPPHFPHRRMGGVEKPQTLATQALTNRQGED